jgi:hypothetical protein
MTRSWQAFADFTCRSERRTWKIIERNVTGE